MAIILHNHMYLSSYLSILICSVISLDKICLLKIFMIQSYAVRLGLSALRACLFFCAPYCLGAYKFIGIMVYPISVFIIAKNEEDRIAYAINSVKHWVDEVIVIDSGSSDKTVEVAKNLGASVIYNEWQGYGPQKVFGETLCRNDWLLNIDADEEISTLLAEEIMQIFDSRQLPCQAYILSIKIKMPYGKNPGRWAPSTNVVRLYNKHYAGFKDSTVHDSVVLKNPDAGKIGRLKNPVIHRCFRSISHAIEKINFYSSMQAEDMVMRGKCPSSIRVIIEPFAAFFKAYFLRRYCFYGIDGFIESYIYAFNRTIRIAKAREKWKAKSAVAK